MATSSIQSKATKRDGLDSTTASATLGNKMPEVGDGSNIMIATTPIFKSAVFRGYRGSSQSVTNNQFAKILINTIDFDPGGCFDVANNRYIVRYDGFYVVSGSVGINDLGNGFLATSSIWVSGVLARQQSQIVGNSNLDPKVGVSDIFKLKSGDYVELYGGHTDTTARDVQGQIQATWLSVWLHSYD